MDKFDAEHVGDCFEIDDHAGFAKMADKSLLFIITSNVSSNYSYLRDPPGKFKVGLVKDLNLKGAHEDDLVFHLYHEDKDGKYSLKYAGTIERDRIQALKGFLPFEVQQVELDSILVPYIDKDGLPILKVV